MRLSSDVITRLVSGQSILIGTSSFTANGWKGPFYPVGLKSSDYLPFYAEHFDTVEIDSTFYACPSPQTVTNWALRTPKGFVFSLKVPQTITHEKGLVACEAEFEEFTKVVDILDEKLGVVVFQFPFFDKWKITDRHEFTDRLIPFLKKLPLDYSSQSRFEISSGWMRNSRTCSESTRLSAKG
jgi:uncharacterized protein YecE (DUF72 family)